MLSSILSTLLPLSLRSYTVLFYSIFTILKLTWVPLKFDQTAMGTCCSKEGGKGGWKIDYLQKRDRIKMWVESVSSMQPNMEELELRSPPELVRTHAVADISALPGAMSQTSMNSTLSILHILWCSRVCRQWGWWWGIQTWRWWWHNIPGGNSQQKSGTCRKTVGTGGHWEEKGAVCD